MSVLKLTKDNFTEIKNSNKKVLIDFYADWCGPCKMVSPIIDQIADETDEFLIAKVNVDEEPSLAADFGVMSIPTLIVIENGKIIKQSVGAMPKAKILEMLENK